MNGTEIATRIKRQFGDEAGAQITDSDILRWINDSQREIAHNNDLLQTVATTNVLADQDQYTLPSDVLNLRSVRYDGRKLKFLSPEEAANLLEKGDEVKGEPTHYSVWGLRIDLYPTPVTASETSLQLYYTRQPASMTMLSDTPELPQQYHNRIVEYCLAQAYELDDNMESYRAKMQMFQDGMDRLKGNTDWQSQDVYPSISVSPGDYGDGFGDYYG